MENKDKKPKRPWWEGTSFLIFIGGVAFFIVRHFALDNQNLIGFGFRPICKQVQDFKIMT